MTEEELVEGSRIAQYQILEKLGSGGMGVVYKAQDTRLGRIVALKFLPQHLTLDDEAKARFTREAKTASALDHPNICTIFEIGEHEGRMFIAMAYYEGETLQDAIKKGAIPVEKAIEFIIQMADGLSQSHEKGIVHRDVKPANVILTIHGTVKLLDFGLAKVVEQTQLTKEGATPGTIAYMSPEQARGEQIDSRTDLWALGAVLYEMLTGERPFRGVYDQAIIYGILNQDPPLITDTHPDVSSELVHIVARLLSKKADERYQTAEELLTDLKSLREGDSSSGMQSESASQESHLRSKELPRTDSFKMWKPVAIGVVLLSLVAAMWIFWQWDREAVSPGGAAASTTQSIAVLPFETIGQPNATPFSDGIHGDVLTRLSDVSNLRVISRTSVRQYRNTEKTILEIGRELGVSWLLEGDVQEAGTQVRVNVRLVDTRNDRQVWADNYQEELTAENIFHIQTEITKKIVRALEIQLTPEENQRIEQIPTDNLVAYRLYVQGHVLLNDRTEQGMRRAADVFQRAIDEDPGYALAWVGRADALTLLYNYRFEKSADILDLAEQAIQEALKIDPKLPEVHASLGLMYGSRHDGPMAKQHLTTAVKLRPGYANAHNWLSWGHLLLGQREAALESAGRAVELDPLSPEIIGNLSLSLLVTGEAERALKEVRRESEFQGSWPTGRLIEGLALFDLGRFQEAETVLKTLEVEWAGSGPRTILAMIHVKTENLAKALDLLDEFKESGDAFAAGLVYAAMGDTEAALEAFHNTEDWNDWRTIAVRLLFRNILEPLTDDPRYHELIREVDRAWKMETSESQP